MTLRNEERELQIELTELQIEQHRTAFLFIGMLVLEVAVILAFETVYFSLCGNLQTFLLRTIMASMVIAMVPIIYITYVHFQTKERNLKEQIRKLRKRYVW